MIHWPAPEKISKVSATILERFKKTAGAKDLEQDSRAWTAIAWSWLPDPPLTLTFRCADGEERYFIHENDTWQMRVIHEPGNLSVGM